MRTVALVVAVAGLVAGCGAENPPAPIQETYVSKTGFQAVTIPRPGEPQATYVLLDAWADGPDHVVTVSKRTGPSGTNYTRRRVNCSKARLITLGEGETVEAMMLGRPDPQEGDMVGGSSATVTSVTACGLLKR